MSKVERLKKMGLLTIGILAFQLAYSQNNYISGYVVKNKTDTLYGFVNYRNWKNNPDNIKFKANMDDKPISFKPTDITEFQVEGEIYVSGIIHIEVSPLQTNDLKEESEINIRVDTAFLQTLYQGEKSLYFYKNSKSKENFYIKQDSAFSLLEYKRYLRQQDGKRVISENKNYLGQLAFYLNDCKTINRKIEKTSYNQKDLLELFQYYYKCSSSAISFQKEFEKSHMEIGVLAGLSSTSLSFSSYNFDYLVKTKFNSSVNFSSGVFFDLVLPRNQGKWSINNEILFSTYKVKTNYEKSGYYSVINSQIGYSYLKINNLLRFKYPIGHLFIFLNGGISNGLSISETNNRIEESSLEPTKILLEDRVLYETRKLEQGLIVGTGIKYNRLSFEVRYENGNGMSKYRSLKSSTKRYFLLLGYRF
ncbi:hypothetical protein [uncultured Arcticibacterium sp.]|uniref:hypothetical protein n=1 Tax=uncultured Arcticibacterium sp. TaxID=2173042 RepID=UPI0030F52717